MSQSIGLTKENFVKYLIGLGFKDPKTPEQFERNKELNLKIDIIMGTVYGQ